MIFYSIEKVRENRWSAETFATLTRSKARNAKRNKVWHGRFLLDGPARSGNTFASFTVKSLLGVTDFVHHKHKIAALKVALQSEIPIYILFREPREVVLSNALYTSSRLQEFSWPFTQIDRQSRFMIDYYLYRWVRYYRFAIALNDVRYFDASDIFTSPKIIAQTISEDLSLEIIADDADLSAEYLNRKRSQSERQGNKLGSGMPNEDKASRKDKMKHLVDTSQYYPEASALYRELRNYRVV